MNCLFCDDTRVPHCPAVSGPTAVLLTGTVGVGKTTTAEAVRSQLAKDGVPQAVIDLDWLSQCWPAPPADPFNFALQLRNLRAVANAFLAAGARRLVLAGVVETRADRERYGEAVGVPLAVRLRADLDVVRTRLAGRHAHEVAELPWYLNRAGELDGILDGSAVADDTLDVTRLRADAAAAAVLDKLAEHGRD